MKLLFATGNKHKIEEMTPILSEAGVELEQVKIDYPEDRDKTIQEIAKSGAKYCCEKLNKPVIVEDTGIFFNAYPNFPGSAPKYCYHALGYEGLYKLIKGEDKGMKFVSVIGYCEPGKEPIIFEGEWKGKMSDKPQNMDADVMPYERIFIGDGAGKTSSELTREEKRKFSHRSKATKKLTAYLNNSG